MLHIKERPGFSNAVFHSNGTRDAAGERSELRHSGPQRPRSSDRFVMACSTAQIRRVARNRHVGTDGLWVAYAPLDTSAYTAVADPPLLFALEQFASTHGVEARLVA